MANDYLSLCKRKDSDRDNEDEQGGKSPSSEGRPTDLRQEQEGENCLERPCAAGEGENAYLIDRRKKKRGKRSRPLLLRTPIEKGT